MTRAEKEQRSITRREFVKGVAAGAAIGMGAFAGCAFPAPGVPQRWDEEADVLVLGLGFAGQATALTAHDQGANVLVLEKASESKAGGNSRVSGQCIAIPEQADVDNEFAYMKAMTSGQGYPVPEDLLRTFVEGYAQNKKWLETLGAILSFRPRAATYPELASAKYSQNVWSYAGTAPGRVWYFLMQQVRQRKIRILYTTPGKRLIRHPETKEIIGVEAVREGQAVYVKAKKGVVLCCGGYEFNQQMIRDFTRLPKSYSSGSPYNTGDGVKMAMDVGADLWHMGGFNAPSGYGVKVPEYDSVFGALYPPGGFINVGADSKRYEDELKEHVCGKTNSHGAWLEVHYPLPIHLIYDEQARLNSGPLFGLSTWNAQMEGFVPSEGNSEEIEKGWIATASSIRGLAAKIGRDPGVLEQTVIRWNECCELGEDPEYGRTELLVPITRPPFYATELVPLFTNTQGGPRRNSQGQVLDVWGDPIPRLYVAGELGDVFSWLYEPCRNISGCFAFGRISGSHAAAQKPWS